MMQEANMMARKKPCTGPRWELIVWAYIKMFLANLLLIGTTLAWITMYGDDSEIISNSFATIIAVVETVLSGMFIYGCNKKSVSVMNNYYLFNQFFLCSLAAVCLYEIVGFGFVISDILFGMSLSWIFVLITKITLYINLGVGVRIFCLVGRLIRNKNYNQDGPDSEYLFKKENLYEDPETFVENQKTVPGEEEKSKNAVLAA